MNNSQKLVKEIADANNSFASKVAKTVLETGNCSYKQFEILYEAASDFIEWDELQVIDFKHDAKFEKMQQNQIKNQSTGL